MTVARTAGPDAGFEGELSDADRDHAPGGTHALTWEDGELVRRTLPHGGRAPRTGCVEAAGFRTRARVAAPVGPDVGADPGRRRPHPGGRRPRARVAPGRFDRLRRLTRDRRDGDLG